MSNTTSTTPTTGERVTRLEDAFVRIEKQVGDTNKSLERFIQDSTDYRENQLKSKQTNWFALVGAICVTLGLMFSVFIAALSALWLVITMQISSNVQPVRDQVVGMQSQWGNTKKTVDESSSQLVSIIAQNAIAIKDRDDMRHDIYLVRDIADKATLQTYGIIKDLQETESQFKKSQDEFNLVHAHDERKFSDIQNTLHEMKAPIPSAPIAPFYFPSVPEVKR